MTDETKPILSGDPQPTRAVTVGGMENKRDASGDQTVSVRALKTFHKDGNMQGDMTTLGDEFEVDRHRAAQLRANGLIEYANESDGHAIHGEIDSKRLDEKVRLQVEQSKIPENSKGTPLRNPEIKLAEAPVDSSKRK